MPKLLLLGFLLTLPFTKWVHAFHPYNLSDSSLFDSYDTSFAATLNPLMVGLTLIHGADAKQAGTLFIRPFFLPANLNLSSLFLLFFSTYLRFVDGKYNGGSYWFLICRFLL